MSDKSPPKKAYYHYAIKVGIFVVHVQAHSWEEAIQKCIDADMFPNYEATHKAVCIEVRKIRGKRDA